jgi:pimeloyl-ACP methyl ester carboxylesterase
VTCWLTILVTPIGALCPVRYFRRVEPERLDQGLVLVFPGIEGRSFLNLSILNGLIAGHVKSAVEVVDWTTGYKAMVLYHLRGWKRNVAVADKLAARIVEYQDQYPGRPVWIVGHSGGGGMAMLTASALPEGHTLTGIVLLATASAPGLDVQQVLSRVDRSVWSYYSWLDAFFLIAGTSVAGTFEGRHGPAAGAIRFRGAQADAASAAGRLIQVPWSWRMLRQFHPGGHFGCVHSVFISEEIAPLIRATELSPRQP